jgi:hypothetical protein
MTQNDYSSALQPDLSSEADALSSDNVQEASSDETLNRGPFFLLTEAITFVPMAAAPGEAKPVSGLPSGMARLLSAIGLSVALLGPLSSCSSSEQSALPCPVPTPRPAGIIGSEETPTATCRTSKGTRYVWVHSRGGWVRSNDGIHPNAGESGIGVNDGYSRGKGGIGTGHSGTDGGSYGG